MDSIAAHQARARRSRIITIATIILIAALIVVGFIIAGKSSRPDVNRPRVEHDIAATFPRIYHVRQTQAGQTPTSATVDHVLCGRGGPKQKDVGPGKDWICTIDYTHGGTKTTARYELFVHGEACYTATDPKRISDQAITDIKTKKVEPDLLFQFDGCFDVYDNRTSTTS